MTTNFLDASMRAMIWWDSGKRAQISLDDKFLSRWQGRTQLSYVKVYVQAPKPHPSATYPRIF